MATYDRHQIEVGSKVKVSKIHTKSANLRLNLLSISFGVAFYL